ncbi:trehalose phosphatase [Intrasporangium oryzae NRRL B-24470]|uniref:Trehalose 6-phosphate phosphatase n=1 Tax=Intrasporangium oryzae NRRL B-24470 TaxID=1386089 RepID=W9G3G2_9MICO|nr:trehalose-phosphatase [Intrasporangium oryzae]EWS99846.1 trehalose phosphatase [Intrasporangium oryzae NRRL B-24470]
MSETPTLDEALESAAGATTLLVATDFDGVLAPFEKNPLEATPVPGTVDDLRALAALPGVHVAVVSGRDLETLRALTGIREDEPIVLIASHGAESSSEAVRSAMEAASVTAEDEERLAVLREDIRILLDDRHPQAGIEHKAAAVVVHTRGLDREVADAAIADARRVALEHPGVKVLKGKSVLELSVSHADKGSAVTAYGRDVGATARVYLGDDVTDEDAFMRMTRPEDVTVKVGSGSTAARHRIDDEEAAAKLLTQLVRLREAHAAGEVRGETSRPNG